jgi:nicotinamidase-related amidase
MALQANGSDMMTCQKLRYVAVAVTMMVTSCGHPADPPAAAKVTAPRPSATAVPLDRSHTALLVMDLQQAIIGMGGSTVQDSVTHTAIAESVSRRAGVKIVFVGTAFTPGYSELSPRNKAFARLIGTGRMLQGSAEAGWDPRIAPVGDEPVILKHHVGAFSAAPVQQRLQAEHVDTVVLTGLATSGVVLSTALAAADLDYRVLVLSDCVADADPDVNRVVLDTILPTQVTVIDSDQYAVALR